MTINKSQGQSFKVVELDLETECFSHGQLYVGCSRAIDENQLYTLANNGMTRNIEYWYTRKYYKIYYFFKNIYYFIEIITYISIKVNQSSD